MQSELSFLSFIIACPLPNILCSANRFRTAPHVWRECTKYEFIITAERKEQQWKKQLVNINDFIFPIVALCVFIYLERYTNCLCTELHGPWRIDKTSTNRIYPKTKELHLPSAHNFNVDGSAWEWEKHAMKLRKNYISFCGVLCGIFDAFDWGKNRPYKKPTKFVKWYHSVVYIRETKNQNVEGTSWASTQSIDCN